MHRGTVVLCGLDGNLKRTLNNDGRVRAFQVLLCSGEDFDFLVVSLNTGVQVWSSDGKHMIYFFSASGSANFSDDDAQCTKLQGIAMVPKGRMFVVGCTDGDVFAFEAKCGRQGESVELTATLRGHDRPITCAGASVEYCVTGDAGGTIIAWNVNKLLEKTCCFGGTGNPVTAVCVRGEQIVAAYSTGHLRIFEIRNETLVVEIAAHSRAINAIDLHPMGTMLATVGEDFFMNVWELPQGGPDDPAGQVGLLASSRVPNRLLTGVRFLVDGSQRIAATSYDCNALHLWHRL